MISEVHQIEDYSLTFQSADSLSYYISKPLYEKHKILVVFTTRQTGVSHSPYASLNLAFHVGDDRGQVIKNRELLCGHFGLDVSRVTGAEQVHGAKAAVIAGQDIGKGAFSIDDSVKGVDALVTDRDLAPLLLLFADCVPIILVEPKRRVVAVIHAGWRGIYGNIIANTIQMMNSSRLISSEELIAFMGPSIGGCCFQVGSDLITRFLERFGAGGSWLNEDKIDLKELAKGQLVEAGVSINRIYFCKDCCTSCNSEVFYSYRADGGKTGRQAAMAVILTI